MKIVSLLSSMLLALALTIASASANLLTNSGFETGDFTGWSNSGFSGVNTFSAHSGNFGAYMGLTEVDTVVSQNINTTAGSLYDVSFFLQAFTPKSQSHTNALGGFGTNFQVFWNGTLIFNLIGGDSFSYTQYGFTNLAATGSTTTLSFVYNFSSDASIEGGGGSLIYNLDDVSVNAAAVGVPESLSTLWLLGPAAGMLLAPRRRRQVA